MIHYRQCLLEKPGQDKTSCMTTWLPEEYAKLGKYVELKQEDDTWENGWKVTAVGARMAEDTLMERSQDYKRTRKASDI